MSPVFYVVAILYAALMAVPAGLGLILLLTGTYGPAYGDKGAVWCLIPAAVCWILVGALVVLWNACLEPLF